MKYTNFQKTFTEGNTRKLSSCSLCLQVCDVIKFWDNHALMRINNPLAVASCKWAMAAAKLRSFMLFVEYDLWCSSKQCKNELTHALLHLCCREIAIFVGDMCVREEFLFLPLKSLWNGQCSLHFKLLFTVTCLKWLTKDLLKNDSPSKVRLSPNCVLKRKREDKNIFFLPFRACTDQSHPCSTTLFSLDHKGRSSKPNRKKWERSDSPDSDSVELTTPLTTPILNLIQISS